MSDTELFEIVRELTDDVEEMKLIHGRQIEVLRRRADASEAKSLAMYLEMRSWQSAKSWNGSPPESVVAEWKLEWEAFGESEPDYRRVPSMPYGPGQAAHDEYKAKLAEEGLAEKPAIPYPIFEVGDLVECVKECEQKRLTDKHRLHITVGTIGIVEFPSKVGLKLKETPLLWPTSHFKLIEKAKKPALPSPKIEVGDLVEAIEDCGKEGRNWFIQKGTQCEVVQVSEVSTILTDECSVWFEVSKFRLIAKSRKNLPVVPAIGSPADDSEPVTEEWLLSLGFLKGLRDGGEIYRSNAISRDHHEPMELHWMDLPKSWMIPHCLSIHPETRRDIRLFAELMRIELKEPK